MKINKRLTKRNYTKGSGKKNLYIVIHYTANNGDTALNNCVYFEKEYRGASANYFVDENEIWQCVEDTDIAWHVGGAKVYYNDARNNNSIGVEMCSRKDADGNYYFLTKTVVNTQELVRYLMDKYSIPIENVVTHYETTHKICPEPFVRDPQLWADFKEGLVYEEADESEPGIYNKMSDLPDWAKSSVQKALDVGVLKGTGKGLGLTLTEVKMIVWLDRCKCLDFID